MPNKSAGYFTPGRVLAFLLVLSIALLLLMRLSVQREAPTVATPADGEDEVVRAGQEEHVVTGQGYEGSKTRDVPESEKESNLNEQMLPLDEDLEPTPELSGDDVTLGTESQIPGISGTGTPKDPYRIVGKPPGPEERQAYRSAMKKNLDDTSSHFFSRAGRAFNPTVRDTLDQLFYYYSDLAAGFSILEMQERICGVYESFGLISSDDLPCQKRHHEKAQWSRIRGQRLLDAVDIGRYSSDSYRLGAQNMETAVRSEERATGLLVGCVVVRVIDGDTLVVNHRGRFESVRLLRIDTPEQGEPGYYEATTALQNLVQQAETVILAFERPCGEERDDYGRLLCYVIVDGEIVNIEMVRLGWSPFWTRYGAGRFAGCFRRAEEEARVLGRGLW